MQPAHAEPTRCGWGRCEVVPIIESRVTAFCETGQLASAEWLHIESRVTAVCQTGQLASAEWLHIGDSLLVSAVDCYNGLNVKFSVSGSC